MPGAQRTLDQHPKKCMIPFTLAPLCSRRFHLIYPPCDLMNKNSIFVTADGKNLLFTFTLISSLFLLWGFCNGMIDVMDKHFQKELNLTLAQSAWVQFAHYLGYFLMALPAGRLATKLGYKGGSSQGC